MGDERAIGFAMASWARKFYAKRRDIALGESGDVEVFAYIKRGRRNCVAAGTPPDSRLNELIALGRRRFVLVFILVLVLWFLWLLRLWTLLRSRRRLLLLFLLRLRLLLLLWLLLHVLLLFRLPLLLLRLRISLRGRRGIGRRDRRRPFVAGRSVRLCVRWRGARSRVGRIRRPDRCRLVVSILARRFVRLRVRASVAGFRSVIRSVP